MGKAAFGATPSTGQATVSGTAAPLVAAATGVGQGTGRCSSGLVLYARASNSVSVFVGNSAVTTSTGYELEAGKAISLDVDDPSKIYVVCASTSPVVSWIYL